MTLADLLSQYGYLAVFIGSLLEGETILTLAGYFIHQGYLSFIITVIIAACGGMIGDQLFFFLGRYYGHLIIARFPRLNNPVNKMNKLITAHQTSIIISVRFMYGFRIAGPIALGMSSVKITHFMLFNAIGAAIWSCLIVSVGYVFGQTLQWLLKDVKQYEQLAFIVIISVIILYLIIRYYYHYHKSKQRTHDKK